MDITGTADKDSLDGTAGPDEISGLGGADTLRGLGGIDLLLGGGGSDVLFYDPLDDIRGGPGIDRLRVAGAGVDLDLGSASLASIEVIELTGSGNNSLQLSAAQLSALSDTGVLRVDGNAGDQVSAGAGWTFNGTLTLAGATYFEYLKGDATLQVEAGIDRSGIGLKMSAADPVARLPVPSLLGDGNPWGTTLSAAGDVNGDGFQDFIVGSSKENSYGGHAYVIFGNASGIADMSEPALDGTNGFVIAGDDGAGERAGMAVSGGGDLNGDGFADLLVAAPRGVSASYGGAGRTYVIFGKADWPASIATGDAPAIVGAGANESSGRSVAIAGDVNGDGRDDFLVGSPYASGGGAYLIFGKGGVWNDLDLGALSPTRGVRVSGAAAGDYAGFSVSGAGDINGDGRDDFIIGAPLAQPDGAYQAGKAYVVFGKGAGWANLDLSALDPASTGFEISGASANDRAGWSVSGAGDVNGDGFADLLVGAPANRQDDAVTSPGRAYLIFGKAAGWTDIDLEALGTDGVRLRGALDDDYAGLSVSAAGDVNADGYDDFIVGAFADQGAIQGASYVVFGKATGWTHVTLSELSGRDGFVLSPDEGANYSGITVSAAGDVNGDGYDDLLTAASDPSPVEHDSAFLDAVGGALFLGGDFRGDIDLPGTAADDRLSGGPGVNRIVGGLGNDRLDGGAGADVMYGGAGNDRLIYRGHVDQRVDGGLDHDKLEFAASASGLDLRAVPDSKLRGIEAIWLDGGGDDLLQLRPLDLLNLSDTTNTLKVNGDAGDTVQLYGTWAAAGERTVGGVLYEQYTSGLAILLVEPEITVL